MTILKRRIKDASTNQLITDRVWPGLPEDLVFTFSYEYNDAGMVTKMIYPDGGEHNFEYDTVLYCGNNPFNAIDPMGLVNESAYMKTTVYDVRDGRVFTEYNGAIAAVIAVIAYDHDIKETIEKYTDSVINR